jgi:hypothetical protein
MSKLKEMSKMGRGRVNRKRRIKIGRRRVKWGEDGKF